MRLHHTNQTLDEQKWARIACNALASTSRMAQRFPANSDYSRPLNQFRILQSDIFKIQNYFHEFE